VKLSRRSRSRRRRRPRLTRATRYQIFGSRLRRSSSHLGWVEQRPLATAEFAVTGLRRNPIFRCEHLALPCSVVKSLQCPRGQFAPACSLELQCLNGAGSIHRACRACRATARHPRPVSKGFAGYKHLVVLGFRLALSLSSFWRRREVQVESSDTATRHDGSRRSKTDLSHLRQKVDPPALSRQECLAATSAAYRSDSSLGDGLLSA